MPNTRIRGFGDAVGLGVARIIAGVSTGGGLAPTTQRLMSNGAASSSRSVSSDGGVITYTQQITPGTPPTGAAGDPILIPGGPWAATVFGKGEWDDIFAGVTDVGTGDPDGSWVAHRPAGSAETANGPGYIGIFNGPFSTTPTAAATGSGAGDVVVTVQLVRQIAGN